MPGTFKGTEEERTALDAFAKLTRTAESLIARVHRHLAEKGITTSQFGVLEMIYHRRELVAELLPTYADKVVEQMGVLTVVEMEELGTLCKKLGKQDDLYPGEPGKAA